MQNSRTMVILTGVGRLGQSSYAHCDLMVELHSRLRVRKSTRWSVCNQCPSFFFSLSLSIFFSLSHSLFCSLSLYLLLSLSLYIYLSLLSPLGNTVCLSACLPAFLPACLAGPSVRPVIRPLVPPSIHPSSFGHPSVCLLVRPCLSVCLSVCWCVLASVCQSISVPVYKSQGVMNPKQLLQQQSSRYSIFRLFYAQCYSGLEWLTLLLSAVLCFFDLQLFSALDMAEVFGTQDGNEGGGHIGIDRGVGVVHFQT